MTRSSDPAVRRAQRVLQMVHELHKLGHQRIRICPMMSATGLAWRCVVTHAGNMEPAHGARLKRYDGRDSVSYSSAQEASYFGWDDARGDTARELAARFLDRCAPIACLGRGEDWFYAGWYVQMLGLADRGVFPLAHGDFYQEDDPDWMRTTGGPDDRLPCPPRPPQEPAGG